MKWWLIAWREIRWEVFLDRASLLRTGVFVVIPLFFVVSNRGLAAGRARALAGAALRGARALAAVSGHDGQRHHDRRRARQDEPRRATDRRARHRAVSGALRRSRLLRVAAR